MSEVTQRSVSDVEDIAANLGLVCFIPTSYELILDLDGTTKPGNGSSAELNNRVLEVLIENGIDVLSTLETTSKSGNKHVYIRTKKSISRCWRLTIQAALGSDPIKEVLSALRDMQGVGEASTTLFETPSEAERVRAWRKLIHDTDWFD